MLLAILNLKAEFVVKSLNEIKNERVVRQNYEQSCGAAALATLINLLEDKKLSELDLLKTMDENKLVTDMLSFFDLKYMANKLHFNVHSYQIEKE